MGCCQASPITSTTNPPPSEPHEIKTDESLFSSNERTLQYHISSALHIAEVFRTHSTNSFMLIREFNTAAQQLKLNVTEMDTLDSNVYNFYRYFREGKGFSAAKLTVLGAVLGSGNVQDKLKAAWSVLPDAAADSSVPSKSIKWLLEMIFEIAGEALLILSKGDPYASHRSVEENEVLNTIEAFRGVKDEAVRVLLDSFMGGQENIRLEEAEERVKTQEKLRKLWKSDGARNLLMEIGKPGTA